VLQTNPANALAVESNDVAIQFGIACDLESAPLAAELGFHGYQGTRRNILHRLPVAGLSLAIQKKQNRGNDPIGNATVSH